MGSKSTFQFLGVDKVSPELKKINASLNKFNDTAKNVGKAVAGYLAFDKIKDFGIESYKAFAGKEVVINRFKESLKSAGIVSNDVAQKFVNLANKLEVTAGIDDSEVLNLTSKFIDLGRSASEVEKLLNVASDLSALTGDGLSTSMDMLTKADTGNVKALKTLLPELKNLTEEQIKNGEAVDLVASKVSGLSDKIYGGAITGINSLGAGWEAFSESIGHVLSQETGIGGFLGGLGSYFDNIASGIERSLLAGKDITRFIKSARVEELKLAQETLQARQDQVTPGMNIIAGSIEKAKLKMPTLRGKTDQEFYDALYLMNDATLKALDPRLLEVMQKLKDNMATATSAQFGLAVIEMNKQALQLTEINTKIKALQVDPPKAVVDLSDEDRKLLNEIGAPVTKYITIDVKGSKSNTWSDIPFGFTDSKGEITDQRLKDSSSIPLNKDNKRKNGANKGNGDIDFSGIFDEALDLTNTFADGLTSLYSLWGSLQREQDQSVIDGLKRQQQEVSTTYDLQRRTKENLGEDTTSLDNEYATNYLKTQEEISNKERELKKKSWESNKQSQLTSAWMGTANATISALGAFPFGPWNIASASAIGLMGLGQIGLISSQSMPSFDVGTSRVPYDMTAQIHKNEMIIPATFSESIRKGDVSIGGGSGQTNNFYFTGIIGADAVREAERLKIQLKKEGTL